MKSRPSTAVAVLGTALACSSSSKAESRSPPDASAADPVYGVGSVGFLYSRVFGDDGGNAVGGEASYTYFPDPGPPVSGFGAFFQAQAYPQDTARFALGAQFVHSVLGAELGWAYRSGGGAHDATHGLHVAPFLSLGVIHVAPRVTIAFGSGDRSWGSEFALTFGLKAPFPAPNFPDYIDLGVPSGRPLRTAPFGRPRLARIRVEPALDTARRASARKRPARAASHSESLVRWLRIAQEEHASIATFARLTHELARLGAPAELVTAALGAALQELGHSRSALDVAARVARSRVTLGALPDAAPRDLILRDLVVESYVDGCLGEGLAAEVARRARHRRAPRAERRFHSLVAREEKEHAELAWSIVRWGLRVGGRPVRDGLVRALDVKIGADLDEPERRCARLVRRRARRRLRRWLGETLGRSDRPSGSPERERKNVRYGSPRTSRV